MSLTRTSLLALTIGALLARGMLAGAEEANKAETEDAKTPKTASDEAQVGPVHSAAEWLGLAIRSDDGEDVARVEDLALDLEQGCVGFVVASLIQSPQSDAARVGLPLELLHRSGKTLTANCSADRLRKAPLLEDANWVETVTRLWAMDVYEYFELDTPWRDRQDLELWSPTEKFGRLFDPDKIKTFSGKISRVDYVPPLPGMSVGVQLTLQEGDQARLVQLGPLWYLSRQDVKFKPEQQASVTGSEITLDKRPLIVATKIELGDEKLKLRESNGSVVWHAWTKQDASQRFFRLADLRDKKICNDEGEEVGRLRDFAVSDDGNRLAYAAVKLADPGRGDSDKGSGDKSSDKDKKERWRAIPLGAFVVEANSRQWVLELPEKFVNEMSGFGPDGEWPEKVGRGWIEYVHVRYGRPAVGGVRHDERGETNRKR